MPCYVPNSEELNFKVGPSFIGYRRLFSTQTQDGSFSRLETSIFYPSWKQTVLTKQVGIKLLELGT